MIVAIMPASARAEGEASWPGSAAAELTRQGREHANNGDDPLAMRRFAEAVRLDPSYGPAYLALAAARERTGDFPEAERTYNVAIEHIPNFVAALRARAALLRRMGESTREIADLEHVARLTEEPDSLRALAARYVENKAWPAALTMFRCLHVLAEERGDEALVREAALRVRALAVLCGELDPVLAGSAERGPVRRALASVARRRGM
jgi:tetratricopeptide (TPR) repeat protein